MPGTEAASCAIISGFRAPPPATISSSTSARGKIKPAEGVRDGKGSEHRRGAHQVRRLGMMPFAPGDQPLHIRPPELLAAGGFRGSLSQIRLPHHSRQQILNRAAAQRDARPAVVFRAPPRHALHQGVHDHVARAGIEGEHVLGTRARGNHRHVGDSADVQRHASALRRRDRADSPRRAPAARPGRPRRCPPGENSRWSARRSVRRSRWLRQFAAWRPRARRPPDARGAPW